MDDIKFTNQTARAFMKESFTINNKWINFFVTREFTVHKSFLVSLFCLFYEIITFGKAVWYNLLLTVRLLLSCIICLYQSKLSTSQFFSKSKIIFFIIKIQKLLFSVCSNYWCIFKHRWYRSICYLNTVQIV